MAWSPDGQQRKRSAWMAYEPGLNPIHGFPYLEGESRLVAGSLSRLCFWLSYWWCLMNRVTAIVSLVAAVIIAVLAVLLALAKSDLSTAESDKRVLESDNALQGQVIVTQAFNINRFNKTAQLAAQVNAIVVAGSEKTVIKYREILRREKTCDLPVPADVAGGLLNYANRLRSSAMRTDSGNVDAADDGASASSGLTYCRAVLWIEMLLSTIEQGNNNFAGVRDIEQQRQKSNEDSAMKQ